MNSLTGSSRGKGSQHKQQENGGQKRKFSHHGHSKEEPPRQQTGRGSFSVERGRPDQCFGDDNSTSKRAKHTNNRKAAPATTVSEMYAFVPKPIMNGSSNTMVDLTGSSPPSGTPLRPTNGQKRQPMRGLNPHAGAKKLVVKNLKPNGAWDGKAYLEKIWAQVDTALSTIFKGEPDNVGKEELYRGVENVCRQGGASTLYSRLESRCRDHVQRDMLGSLLQHADQDSVDVLKATLSQWTQWKTEMLTIRGIFFFLDRSYLLSSSKPSLAELVPQLFRDIVFSHEALKPLVVDGACELVAIDRRGAKKLDRALFKDAVDMFHDLATYTATFEPRFLGLTQQYIGAKSRGMADEMSVTEFVQEANAIIDKEMSRCEDFALDSSTRREMLELLEEHLVGMQQEYLTGEDALASMLNNNAIPEIEALYVMLSRRNLATKLKASFEKWVIDTGTSIVLAKDYDDMIVQLLSLKRRLDLAWRTAFRRDQVLGHGLRESFEVFINKTQKGDATGGTDNTKVGEMIAKYVDQLLRGGAKSIPEVLTTRRSSSITAPNTEALARVASAAAEKDDDNDDEGLDEDTEINIQLDQVLDLFRFVHGKAVFEAFYKKDLARRLLMGRSASADAERSMLARLKTECGAGFTHNLEQMFKDVELARDEMSSYKQRLEDRIGYEKGKNVELSVNILSAAAWPTYPDIPVIIPTNIKKSIDDFELHYKSKHSGRKLDWKHALAHCQMRATFNKGSKELVVSSFQAIVMLLFNNIADGEQLTYQHILSETGLPPAEVKRTLQSLACAKLRPLTKHPKGRDIAETDSFSLNLDFTHPKYRVKINQVQLKETKQENKETHQRVAEDRNFECQAAIVRIMKSRKTISHPELFAEVINATKSRGVLAVADIKKNVDRLIEKDYMEREEGNTYSYIA